MTEAKLDVLGTEYTIKETAYQDDQWFEENDCDGYTNALTKEIVLCEFPTHPCHKGTTEAEYAMLRKEILRHEIIHAFLNESGLRCCAGKAECWPQNEEMVDWIALQGPKICAAWKKADAM